MLWATQIDLVLSVHVQETAELQSCQSPAAVALRAPGRDVLCFEQPRRDWRRAASTKEWVDRASEGREHRLGCSNQRMIAKQNWGYVVGHLAYLPACLPTYLPAYLSSFFPFFPFFLPQHIEGCLFSWPWSCLSSLSDFLFWVPRWKNGRFSV